MMTIRSVGGLLVVVLALVACSRETVSIGSTQQSIVNGVTTWAHPEIGIVHTSSGSWCSATLLSAHAGITAAHCFDETDINSIDAGASFEIFDTNGSSLGLWAIDLGKSLTTAADLYTYVDDHNNHDVYLFHLTSEVAAAIATPASVSSTFPEPGDLATVYGFGCTQRFTSIGDGTKRYASFTYGTQTGILCQGDSGGPTVTGNAQAPISIWGVNSNWTDGPGTTDEWGAVYYFAGSIASVLAGWDQIVEPWVSAFPIING